MRAIKEIAVEIAVIEDELELLGNRRFQLVTRRADLLNELRLTARAATLTSQHDAQGSPVASTEIPACGSAVQTSPGAGQPPSDGAVQQMG